MRFQRKGYEFDSGPSGEAWKTEEEEVSRETLWLNAVDDAETPTRHKQGLLSGCSSRSSANPVRHLLNVLDEDKSVRCLPGFRAELAL